MKPPARTRSGSRNAVVGRPRPYSSGAMRADDPESFQS
ncbi:hypothetical protein SSAG_04035 [Streptomyces sp. Mg1]|nr:hypothetical protein SSAG_04035 [Streptomyces sp. Mg1]